MAGRSLDKKPYGNHKMFSIEDGFLAHVDTKRVIKLLCGLWVR